MSNCERDCYVADLKEKYSLYSVEDLETEKMVLDALKLDLLKNLRRSLYNTKKCTDAESVETFYNLADLLLKIQLELDVINKKREA